MQPYGEHKSSHDIGQISIEAVSNGWTIRIMTSSGMVTSLVEKVPNRDNVDHLLEIVECLLRGSQ